MATLRSLAISLLRMVGWTDIPAANQHMAAHHPRRPQRAWSRIMRTLRSDETERDVLSDVDLGEWAASPVERLPFSNRPSGVKRLPRVGQAAITAAAVRPPSTSSTVPCR